MAGYDPKAKRAHSTAPSGPAPVDDLLGAAPAEPVAPDAAVAPTPPPRAPAAVAPSRPEARPLSPTPAAASGPDPKVLAAALAAVVAVLLFWRHRRRGSD